MKKLLIFAVAAAVSVALTVSAAAATADALYVRTDPIPEHINEYAENLYADLYPEVYRVSSDHILTKKLGAGFCAYSVNDGYEPERTNVIYYFPLADRQGDFVAMLTIVCDTEGNVKSYSCGGDDNAEGLNGLVTSYDDPAEIYMSDQVTYAVTDSEVTVLSAYAPYSSSRIEELKQMLPELRRANEAGATYDVIMAYGNHETGLVMICNRLYCITEKGDYAYGWQDIDGKRYYFRKTGAAVTSSAKINGVYYKFGSDGVCKGEYTGWSKKSGKYYYYKQGRMLKNCWLTIKGKKTYYLDENGIRAVGEVMIKGEVFTFGDNGKLIADC